MCEISKTTLRECIKRHLEQYLSNLDGHKPANVYAMVQREMDIAMLKTVLQYTNNNQSEAAEILDISRGTLRKKIQTLKKFLG